MGLSQAQSVVVGAGFIPDTAETGIRSRNETLRVTEPKRTNGFYEAVLLAVSFIFLLLGLLPSRAEQFSGPHLSGDKQGRIDE